MPSGAPYTMAPVIKLLDRLRRSHHGLWADPFGELKPDALAVLANTPESSLDAILLDPPYSARQAHELYKGRMCLQITPVYDLAASRLKTNGIAVCFGWNSNGLGRKRGMELESVLLLAHGAHHNDTIITVERKMTP